jgi:hypothetical protein
MPRRPPSPQSAAWRMGWAVVGVMVFLTVEYYFDLF